MGDGKAIGDADEEIHDLARRPLLVARPLFQRGTVDELGYQILLAVGLSGLEDGRGVAG